MTHLGERLTDFVFGELPANEMEDARRHVAACADCRNQAEQLEHTRSLLKMSPDVEPPRRILFEFERPRALWRWLIPVGVAAALILAVLIAAPMQMQWHDSQLTLSFGKISAPVPAVAPVTVSQPAVQPIDYERIARQVEDSQRAWLEGELKKQGTAQMREIGQLQGTLAYINAQQQNIARDNALNAASIQKIVDQAGGQ